jgi:hypothetical protein
MAVESEVKNTVHSGTIVSNTQQESMNHANTIDAAQLY